MSRIFNHYDFDSIMNFVDPSVNFVLPFELERASDEHVEIDEKSEQLKSQKVTSEELGEDNQTEEQPIRESADVVSFEAFRKK